MRHFYLSKDGFRHTDDCDSASWIDIQQPDPKDCKMLEEQLGLPPMFLEYLQDADERPRLEREQNWSMVIVRIPIINTDNTMPYTTMPIGVVITPDSKVITISYHPNPLITDFIENSIRKRIAVTSQADFALRIFYSAAYWYLKYLKDIAQDVLGAEKDLQRAIRNDDLIRLMRMQKSLVFFNTSIKGDVMLLERVGKMFETTIDEDLLEDVQIELRQADTTVAIYSNILEGTMDSYASIISNNVNSVMKRMTGLSIILMVPTFIASLYGMNVDILLGDNPHAFWIIIAMTVVFTAIAFIVLRRIRWV